MAEEKKPNPHFDCSANRFTNCGQQDPGASRPWICLNDWLEGWRPDPVTKLAEKIAPRYDLNHLPADVFYPGHAPSGSSTEGPKPTTWRVVFKTALCRADQFIDLTHPHDDLDDAAAEATRLYQNDWNHVQKEILP